MKQWSIAYTKTAEGNNLPTPQTIQELIFNNGHKSYPLVCKWQRTLLFFPVSTGKPINYQVYGWLPQKVHRISARKNWSNQGPQGKDTATISFHFIPPHTYIQIIYNIYNELVRLENEKKCTLSNSVLMYNPKDVFY